MHGYWGEVGGPGLGEASAALHDVGNSLRIHAAFRNQDSMWVCRGGSRRCGPKEMYPVVRRTVAEAS